jgi:hypothetical protein
MITCIYACNFTANKNDFSGRLLIVNTSVKVKEKGKDKGRCMN